ncbi:hypothetical protein LEMLEM_LOCUS3065 [Lemmus lemmus]
MGQAVSPPLCFQGLPSSVDLRQDESRCSPMKTTEVNSLRMEQAD